MNRIYTFALMSALARTLHSLIIGGAIVAVLYTAYMSNQNIELLKKNNDKLSSITSELKTQNNTLTALLKESTKSATISATPTPKE